MNTRGTKGFCRKMWRKTVFDEIIGHGGPIPEHSSIWVYKASVGPNGSTMHSPTWVYNSLYTYNMRLLQRLVALSRCAAGKLCGCVGCVGMGVRGCKYVRGCGLNMCSHLFFPPKCNKPQQMHMHLLSHNTHGPSSHRSLLLPVPQQQQPQLPQQLLLCAVNSHPCFLLFLFTTVLPSHSPYLPSLLRF